MTPATAVRTYWNARSGKERIALAATAAVVFALCLYAALIGPALAARAQLATDLPRLRAQLEEMRLQQQEVIALRKRLGSAAQSRDLSAFLRSAAANTSLQKAAESIRATPDGKAALSAADIVFDDWLAWIENLQRDFSVRVENCKIAALERPGLVRVEAVFAAAGSPAR